MDRRMCHNCTGNMYPDGDGWKCSACGVRVNAEGRHYFPKPIRTNADKIRAMSDEELTDIMSMHTATGACNDWGIPHEKCGGNCRECIIDWLKQPAEVSE